MVKKIASQLFWSLLIVIIYCVFDTAAQSVKSSKIIFDSCATGKAKLAEAGFEFQKNAKPDSYLVIVGGAMKGEKASYNFGRIQQAIPYLDFVAGIKSERIVFGVGISEVESGYLRLYINGILSAEILTRKNGELCWCEGDAFNFKVTKLNLNKKTIAQP